MSQGQGNWVRRNARERDVRGRGWGPGPGPGPVRRAFTVKRTGFSGPPRQSLRSTEQFSQPKSKPIIRKRQFKRSWIPSKEGLETGTKLYISNLDYQIRYPDIYGLFSEIGKLKRCKLHYDRTAQPSGSAEVVYERRVDAVNALKHYNNCSLVGRVMKINIVDNDLGQSMMRRIRVVGDVNKMPQRTVIVPHNFGGSAPPVYKDNWRRFNRGDWMQRNGRINFQRNRQEVVDMPDDEPETEFENLRVEAMYF